jgi:hypothetical protein
LGAVGGGALNRRYLSSTLLLLLSLCLSLSLSLSLSIYIYIEATVLAFSGLSQALIVACRAEEDKQRKEKRKGPKGQSVVWMAEKGKCQSKNILYFC